MKMATGEVIDAESLGGATTHATVTGLADQIAVDEYAEESSCLAVLSVALTKIVKVRCYP